MMLLTEKLYSQKHWEELTRIIKKMEEEINPHNR